MKILIIEDDPIIARVYSTKYAAVEFESCVAPDGEAGLQLVKTFKPDLVHLDLMVPKTNGVEVIKRLRKDPSTSALPIIVLSNTYQNALVKEALAAGATRCVSKSSCTPKMMVDIVSKFAIAPAPPAPPVVAPAVAPVVVPAPAQPARVSPRPPARFPAAVHTVTPPAKDLGPVSKTRELAKHLAFQTEIHADFTKRGPVLISTLRERVEPLLRAQSPEARVVQLVELRRTAKALAGHSGIAGFEQLSETASALEALLGELIEQPEQFGESVSRTFVDAVDSLGVLFAQGGEPTETSRPNLVLVIDADPQSRKSVMESLDRLDVASVGSGDPEASLRLLADNAFNLILVNTDLPNQGLDLCMKLRAMASNQATPVLFVGPTADVEMRAKCVESGGNDLIARPFLSMELALKASSLLRQRRSMNAGTSGPKAEAVRAA